MENSILKIKDYLAVAIPFIIATITQPLLSAVDTAVVGHLSNVGYIAGITLGAVIFNTLYWLFGFFRVNTTGFAAQSTTNKDNTIVIIRPLIIAVSFGLLFILLRDGIFELAMDVYASDNGAETYAKMYFDILIFGAPLVLINYVLLGFLMGKSRIKEVLIMQVTGNILNIFLDLFFVLVFKLNIQGVAIATLISILVSTLIGTYFIVKYGAFERVDLATIFERNGINQMLSNNLDLIIRTACLLIQINIFTSRSAALGIVILSANGILLQIQGIMAYMFDGIANASSIYSGRAKGTNNSILLKSVISVTNKCTIGLIAALTLLYVSFNEYFIAVFTNVSEVIAVAGEYSLWLSLYPLFGGFALTYYGIFSGMGATKYIRNSTIMALILFLAVFMLTLDYNNNGLWMAFLSFCIGRTVFLVMYTKKIYED
ncbi:MATE family efflux transporter [Methanomethylovorans sp.]|uniref:MATE family efflux transporter n=1 Tax=Methanomethylovorans sp. TaxID=2758717 RepID=UPI00345EBBCC